MSTQDLSWETLCQAAKTHNPPPAADHPPGVASKMKRWQHAEYAYVPRTCYVHNPFPTYTPPAALLSALKFEQVNQNYADLKQALLAERNTDTTLRQSIKQDTQLYNALLRMLRRAQQVDILDSTVVMKNIEDGRSGFNRHRRRAVKALVDALITGHDVLTGLLPYATLTSLSNQCGLTTYGHQRYTEFGKQDDVAYDEDDLTGKKQAIQRASRAIAMLAGYGLIEKCVETDPQTGKYVGAVLRLTDRFYHALGYTDDALVAMRKHKLAHNALAQKQRPHQPSTSPLGTTQGLTLDELPGYIEKQRQALIESRQRYAKLQREKRYLKHMDKEAIYRLAIRQVNDHTYPSVRRAMAQSRYDKHVYDRYVFLLALKKEPGRKDDYFANLLAKYPDNSLH